MYVCTVCGGSRVQTTCVCQRTCEDLAKGRVDCPELGSEECVEGCHCLEGMASYDGSCIAEEKCPCLHMGTFLAVRIVVGLF